MKENRIHKGGKQKKTPPSNILLFLVSIPTTYPVKIMLLHLKLWFDRMPFPRKRPIVEYHIRQRPM